MIPQSPRSKRGVLSICTTLVYGVQTRRNHRSCDLSVHVCKVLLQERAARLELALAAWKAVVLPLTPSPLERMIGFGPMTLPWQGSTLPLRYTR